MRDRDFYLVAGLFLGAVALFSLLKKSGKEVVVEKKPAQPESVDVTATISADASASSVPQWAKPIFRRTWDIK